MYLLIELWDADEQPLTGADGQEWDTFRAGLARGFAVALAYLGVRLQAALDDHLLKPAGRRAKVALKVGVTSTYARILPCVYLNADGTSPPLNSSFRFILNAQRNSGLLTFATTLLEDVEHLEPERVASHARDDAIALAERIRIRGLPTPIVEAIQRTAQVIAVLDDRPIPAACERLPTPEAAPAVTAVG